MEIAPLDARTATKDQWWDWGPIMHEAREKARVSGFRYRVYGVYTVFGWHYRLVGKTVKVRSQR